MQKILISVGTTEFEQLIKYTDSKQFFEILKKLDKSQGDLFELRNFEIQYQIGKNGKYIPQHGINFRLSDNISKIYKEADFIICHGGAGTLLENLRNGKKIIAVANDTLAGNHQVELIEKLSSQKYLLGFKNISELRENPQKVQNFFGPQTKFTSYPKINKCILNELLFEQ